MDAVTSTLFELSLNCCSLVGGRGDRDASTAEDDIELPKVQIIVAAKSAQAGISSNHLKHAVGVTTSVNSSPGIR